MSVNLMYSLFIIRRLNKPERPKRHTVTKGSPFMEIVGAGHGRKR